MREIIIHGESWTLQRPFEIARGRKVSADLICVEIKQGKACGRGEAVPYPHYGESVETATAAIETLRPALAQGMGRDDLSHALLAGAARAALDCALWDLEAKQKGVPVWQLPELKGVLDMPRALPTAYTITIDAPEKMAARAKAAKDFPLLKIKLGGRDSIATDLLRLQSIRAVRPDAKLIVDVNEGWQIEDFARHTSHLKAFDILFFEQPVPPAQDMHLSAIDLPLCADESVHDRDDLTTIAPAYQWVNIKLDKAGGLTEALAMAQQARTQGLKIMVGCMVATSLAMAPAHLLGQVADMIDLDGPLWLKEDRKDGFTYKNGIMQPPPASLWG